MHTLPLCHARNRIAGLKKNWTACSRMKIFAAADGRLGTAVAACRCLGPGISIHLNYMCAKTTNWQGAVWVSPKAPAYWVGFCHGTQCREAVTWETVLLACIFCSWLVFKNFTKCVMALEMLKKKNHLSHSFAEIICHSYRKRPWIWHTHILASCFYIRPWSWHFVDLLSKKQWNVFLLFFLLLKKMWIWMNRALFAT